MNLNLVRGDILDAEAEAFVLPSNPKLEEGAGVSHVLFEAAGRSQLKKACKKLPPQKVGLATVTGAYNLDAKFIVHAIVPKWIDGMHDEYELLGSTYYSCLKVADLAGVESIVFPLLASGHNKYDLGLAFKIAQEAISEYQPSNNLRDVTLVLYGDDAVKVAKEHGYEEIHVLRPKLDKDAIKKAAAFAKGEDEREKLPQKALAVILDFMQDPENVKMIIKIGENVYDIVKESGKKAGKIIGKEVIKKVL